MLRNKKPALLLIDIQKGFEKETFFGGNRNNKNAEQVAAKLLKIWRELGLPVYHARHSSRNPESTLHASNPGFAYHELAQPIDGEPTYEKDVNSAFIGTSLKSDLDKAGITTLVMLGLTSNHCVSTTTRMAGNYDYECYVVEDATATFDRVGLNGQVFDAETVHQVSMASLNEEFATVLSSTELLKQL